MLKLAFPYQEKLNQAWRSVIFEDKYQFYNGGAWWDYEIKLDDKSWDSIQMVSVGKNDEVLGYFSARANRSSNKISSVGTINFGDVNVTFSRDFHRFLSELFTKHRFRKIEWYVIVGNPAERLYDKIVAKYGGRVIGVSHETTVTPDGITRDEKDYEIFKRDYELAARRRYGICLGGKKEK
ncbi:MAG: hypothetical protein LBS24_00605 [Clostridiales Family XIII bacterium]|jgi:hypothetical protein|nr:hypothetical protein [Clostridiales Family XIII bacterium]